MSLVAQKIKKLSTIQETWVRSLGQEDPLEKGMATYSSILAWSIPWTQESGAWSIPWTQESSAWSIPWTQESGRLQSMGSERVRHD